MIEEIKQSPVNSIKDLEMGHDVKLVEIEINKDDKPSDLGVCVISRHQFYDYPKYYDKAFTRDTISDMNFFNKCFQQYCDFEVKRLLEPACGPGMFLEKLPELGFYVLGYDLSPSMVAYSKERLRKANVSIKQADAVIGDMKNAKFEDQFDAAFICINSLGYLVYEEDIKSHFKVMGKNIRREGIYIIELSFICNDIRNEKKFDDTWYVKENNLELETTWAVNWYDIEKRIRHVDFRMVIIENGQKIIIEETHNLYLWIFEEFKKIIEQEGFEIMDIYNQNYELISNSIPITGELGAVFVVLKNTKKF